MSKHSSIWRFIAIAALLVLAILTVGCSARGDGAGETTSHTDVGPDEATQTTSPIDVGSLTATAGCGKAPTMSTGTYTIQSSGKNRSFILKLPDNYNNTHPYPIFFAFHWWGGTANDVHSGGTDGAVWSYYGQMGLANNSAIFIAPQGISNAWANSGGEDVTFVDDMIRRLDENLCIETSQRFALGFSYGGGMSYALACARPTVFRAVTVYSGAQLSGCSGGTQPVAYFGIHGINDGTLNISAGRSLRDTFVRNNGCTAQNPPEPRSGSLSHITTTYSGCRAGYPVQWAAFDGGHGPGPIDGAPGESGFRTWTKGEVWRFFSQFMTTVPPTIPTGWVRIANVTTNLVLDSGGNVASGSVIKQRNADGSTDVQWQFVDLGSGFYRLVNRTNGMVADSFGNTSNGANAMQAPWSGSNNQQWSINSLGNGRYQIINRGTGTGLDSTGNTTVGSTVKLWAPNPHTNTQWTLSTI